MRVVIFNASSHRAVSAFAYFNCRFRCYNPQMESKRWALVGGIAVVAAGVCVWQRQRIIQILKQIWEGDREGAIASAALKLERENWDILDNELRALEVRLKKLIAQKPTAGDEEKAGPQNGAISADGVSGLTGKGASGYYHFASDGTKLPSKWDAYDVDAELRRLDEEDGNGSSSGGSSSGSCSGAAAGSGSGSSSKAGRSSVPAWRRSVGQLRTSLGGVEKAVEDCMADVDTIRGGDAHRLERKALVTAFEGLLARVDEAKGRMAAAEADVNGGNAKRKS